MSEYTSEQAAIVILRYLNQPVGIIPVDHIASIIEKTHEPETVICAAIRLPNGKIFRGHRHGDCIRTAAIFVDHRNSRGCPDYPEPWRAPMCNDQGFITSKNRYVGREEGLQIQLKAGIPSVIHGSYREGYHETKLFSEDLY